MIYAVLMMFVGIVSCSLMLSVPMLYIKENFWTNFVVIFLCCIIVWLYMDNISIIYDIENRKKLRQSIIDTMNTIESLREERDELYRDMRLIRNLKYKESKRASMLKSSSCRF
jgi:shikimate kinase